MGMVCKDRDCKYDNMRFFLLLLVICGHFMELISGLDAVYKIVYSFHVPALLFVFGVFAQYDRKKLLKRYVFPYLVFQVLYLFFSSLCIDKQNVVIQFTTPYWLLWFLLAIIVYYICIPALPEKTTKNALIILPASFVLSLISGFDNTLGYYLSASRIVVFFPYFLIGYYLPTFENNERLCNFFYSKWTLIFLLLLTAASSYAVLALGVPARLLYGSYSYEACGSDALCRLIQCLAAVLWIALLLRIMPDKPLAIITTLGRNTMPAYLFHGFMIKIYYVLGVFSYSLWVNVGIMVLSSFVIMAAFSNSYVSKLYRRLFG